MIYIYSIMYSMNSYELLFRPWFVCLSQNSTQFWIGINFVFVSDMVRDDDFKLLLFWLKQRARNLHTS